MRIDGPGIYSRYENLKQDKLNNEVMENAKANSVSKTDTTFDKNSLKTNTLNNVDTSKIITKQERQYFKRLFPESSDLIERHVLFNRNAKMQSPAISKGMIVDGKI